MGNYSRQQSVSLPTNDTDLTTLYSETEKTYLDEEDDISVTQVGTLHYMIHQFKVSTNGQAIIGIDVIGESTLFPNMSPLYLQVYNRVTLVWDTVDTESSLSHDQPFELKIRKLTAANYIDGSNNISCRVYQLAI